MGCAIRNGAGGIKRGIDGFIQRIEPRNPAFFLEVGSNIIHERAQLPH